MCFSKFEFQKLGGKKVVQLLGEQGKLNFHFWAKKKLG